MNTLRNIRKFSMLVAFSSILLISCKDSNSEAEDHSEMNHSEMNSEMDHSEMNHSEMSSEMDHSEMNHSGKAQDTETMHGKTASSKSSSGNEVQSPAVGNILDSYLQVKDALVAENQESAAKAGGDLATALEGLGTGDFEESQQQELKEIIEVAKEHAEHISGSDIAHQREHFDMLSTDIRDFVAITGTDRKLYQARCPMYNENKGAIWLSESAEIRNPYFGKKMLKCGSVQEEIE